MVTHNTRQLAVLDEVSRMLAAATSLDEIRIIRDKAEAARTYVKAAKLGLDLQNRAAEVKLRAERKAGSLLRSLKLRGGDRKSKKHRASLNLQDLGISRDQSKRWQHIASVSDAAFSKYLKDTIDQGREITSAGLLRIAEKRRGTPRTAQSSSSPEAVPGLVESRAGEELFEELMNHCRLLGNVLRPVCEEGGPEMKRGERRVVGRLIGEMTELIVQLRKTWELSDEGH